MTELHGSLGTRGALKGQLGGTAGGGGIPYQIGAGLKVEENVLMVDTANVVEEDNTKPVTRPRCMWRSAILRPCWPHCERGKEYEYPDRNYQTAGLRNTLRAALVAWAWPSPPPM